MSTLILASTRPAVRKSLVRERVRAMRGQLAEALTALSQATELLTDDQYHDAVAIGTLRSELMKLDQQYSEALAYFEANVVPLKKRLTREEQFIVDRNLSDLQFKLFLPVGAVTHYNNLDQERLAGFELFDALGVLQARNAAAEGKHYEALPIVWQQSVTAYMQGCWQSQHMAARYMANESLQLGSLEDAIHHAIMAEDAPLLGEVASAVCNRNDPATVQSILNRIIEFANLRTHFAIACEAIVLLSDYVPDKDVPRLFDWLALRCPEQTACGFSNSVLGMSWKALEAIADRVDSISARRALDIAFAHPIWTTVLDNPNALFVERKQMINTVNLLVSVVDEEELPSIAGACVSLATVRKQVHDYGDAINLLCHIAKRGNAGVKEKILQSLFVTGKPVDRTLAQAASVLGKQLITTDQLSLNAARISREILSQVQIVGADDEPKPVPETVFWATNIIGEKKRVVSVVSLLGLHTIAAHRALLRPDSLREVVDAILAMAQESENALTNRSSLISALTRFADTVDDDARRAICSALEEIARGNIVEPTGLQTEEQANNPLNPIKKGSGRVVDLRSVALIALAEFSLFEDELSRRFSVVIEDAFLDADPLIRRAAYAATGRLPTVTQASLSTLLIGTRDPDANVAMAAFFAMTNQPRWKLDENQWPLFIFVLRAATTVVDVRVRRNAAAAASAWLSRAKGSQWFNPLQSIQETFARDVCASVRELTSSSRNGD